MSPLDLFAVLATALSEAVWTCPNSGETYTAARLAQLLDSRDTFLAKRLLFSEYCDEINGLASADAIASRTPK